VVETSNGAPGSEGNPIRLVLADTQTIYRVGILKTLWQAKDIRVAAEAHSLGELLAALGEDTADVILLESQISLNLPEVLSEVLRRAPSSRIIVLVPEMDESQTVELLRRGVRGVVSRAIAPELLLKCVRKVYEGETWLDNRAVGWLIEAFRQQAAQMPLLRHQIRLSEKEMLIISHVTQGLRNKEIAHELNTTEQVIKNHLRKIYDKLGVTDRLELALYSIQHNLLQPPTNEARSAELEHDRKVTELDV
jgi:DNA-binding NarL/FixJ family response regulator